MPSRTVKTAPTKGLVETLRQFTSVKKAKAEMEDRYKVIRDRVAAEIQANGHEDDKGSLLLDLDALGLASEFREAKYERRTSNALDLDKAEELLKKKRLLAKCQTTITVLDEEKIVEQYYKGKISDDEWDEIYPLKETWAVKVNDA